MINHEVTNLKLPTENNGRSYFRVNDHICSSTKDSFWWVSKLLLVHRDFRL